MSSMLKVGKTALVTGAGVVICAKMATFTVLAEEKSPPSKMVKISEMPIYEDTKDLYDIKYYVSEKGELEKGVSVVRKELCGAVDATKEFREQVKHIYETGKAHTAGQINYLLDEENVGARVGAIATAGFLGLLMGARKKGGFFKKLIYTTTGAGAMTAALHPKDAKEVSDILVKDASTYASVAYNFMVGVKPQNGSSSKAEVPAKPKVETTAITPMKRVESDTKRSVSSDQSNPADADMYTTRS